MQARDVHQAGAVHQGVARDVHGHRCLGREPGRDGEQVKDPLDVTNNFLRSQKFSKSLLRSQKFENTFPSESTLTWRVRLNTRREPLLTPRKLWSTNKKQDSKFHPT